MQVWVYSLVSVLIISSLSFIGVILLLLKRDLAKEHLLYLVSFSVGGLFGGAFLHLLPEALEMEAVENVSMIVMLGIFVSYIIEMIIQWRHCHIPTSEDHPHTFAYMNIIGDGVHNMVDGIIVGSAYLISIPLGISTTIAICLHEIPQEIGDLGVLLYAGMKVGRALTFNLLSALTAVIGMAIALALSNYVSNLTAILIPFAVGNFIYIAGSDLVPELKDEKKLSKSLIQLALMLSGAALLYMLKFLE